MTKGELIKALQEMDCDDDTEILYKFRPTVGTVGEIFYLYRGEFSFFGTRIPCILLDTEPNPAPPPDASGPDEEEE